MESAEAIKQPGSSSAAVVEEAHPADPMALDAGEIVVDVLSLQECP